MRVVRAYRYALNLTSAQQRMVLAHCGAARVAHNWGLARVRPTWTSGGRNGPTGSPGRS